MTCVDLGSTVENAPVAEFLDNLVLPIVEQVAKIMSTSNSLREAKPSYTTSSTESSTSTILNLAPSCLEFSPGCDKYFLVALAVHAPANANKLAFSTLVTRPSFSFSHARASPPMYVAITTRLYFSLARLSSQGESLAKL